MQLRREGHTGICETTAAETVRPGTVWQCTKVFVLPLTLKESIMAPEELPIEAIGEDELERPQPANEPLSEEKSEDLFKHSKRPLRVLKRINPQGEI